jgi:hypothetical protein
MNRHIAACVLLSILLPLTTVAQAQRETIPLTNWSAPLYWQPSQAESRAASARQAGGAPDNTTFAITADAQTPANSLVFVGMTPCRVVDTRNGSGFTGAFGPPSLVGGAKRTFPIQSSTNCSIPSIAQAYSFNITIVPPGFVDFVTVGPTPVSAPPTFSTLNGYVCAFSSSPCVISNAAIVPAGTSGSVDVYASQNTHLIIDINGYYAPQTGITLAQGTAASPSLSFAGDPGTGIFSSGAGNLNIATGGTSRLTLSNSDVNVTGNLDVSGNVGIGTTMPAHALQVDGITSLGGPGGVYGQLVNGPSPGPYPSLGFNTSYNGFSYLAGVAGYGGIFQFQDGDGKFGFYNTGSSVAAGAPQAFIPRVIVLNNGNVGIGTTMPTFGKLQVKDSSTAVYSESDFGYGVYAYSNNWVGVKGDSASGFGVFGDSISGPGVYGRSGSGYAGDFQGNVHVTGGIVQGSDLRLKDGVANLGYGLHEVLQLRPVTWHWKDKPDHRQQLGLIAQEVETVLPELVSTEKDAEQTKGLNYIGLVPVTIKAIQEQQAQIEDQQKRISEQQAKIAQQQERITGQEEQNRKLEERLAALEALLNKVSSHAVEQE